MKVTCFIEYKLDAYKINQFTQYAEHWAKIIPRCGGELVGYFLPHEGSNNHGFGLISFASLGEYELYRNRLKKDQQAQENFKFAREEKFILEEKRSFLNVVESSYWLNAINQKAEV